MRRGFRRSGGLALKQRCSASWSRATGRGNGDEGRAETGDVGQQPMTKTMTMGRN
jgi:hypothetical protein